MNDAVLIRGLRFSRDVVIVVCGGANDGGPGYAPPPTTV